MSQDLWKSKSDWFVDWFNSEAYHLLYNNRDEDEAFRFIQRVSSQILDSRSQRLLDLGCGKGRHAVSLASMGHEVVGVDLSERSILFAQNANKDNDLLSFLRADMRELHHQLAKSSFDGALLLFTSFGYFEDDKDHEVVLKQVLNLIRPKGVFLLDYFNLDNVRDMLKEHELIHRGGLIFEIDRRIHNGWVEKSIRYVSREGKREHVVERVRAFSPKELQSLCENAGFQNFKFFGNYQLEVLSRRSQRCILVARK